MNQDSVKYIKDATDDFVNKLSEVDNSLGKIAKTNSAFKASMITLANEFRNNGKASEQLTKDIKSQVKEMREAEIAVKRLEAEYKKAMWAAGDFSVKSKMVAASVDDMAKKFGTFFSAISGGELFKLKNVTQELTTFNRKSFELSRQMQVLGQSFKMGDLDNFSKNLNLSRTQTVALASDFVNITNSGSDAIKMFKGLSSLARDRFGGTPEVLKDAMSQFTLLDNMLPGLNGEFTRMQESNEAFNGSLASTLLTMKGYGASNQQLQFMAQAMTNVSEEQKKMLTYETAVQERQKAIADENLRTGKNSEWALIQIEKSMTQLVKVSSNLMNSFSAIPSVLLSLSSIGVTSAMSIAKALDVAIGKVRTLGAESSKAGGSLKGMGRSVGIVGGLTMAASIGMGVYDIYKGATADSGGDTYDERAAKRNENNKRFSRGVGTVAGAVIGGAIGSVVPVLGTAIGAGVGGMVGGAVGEWWGGRENSANGKTSGMIKALSSAGFEDAEKLDSESQVYEMIKKTEDSKKRNLAIDSLIKGAKVSEKEIQEKLGDEVLNAYKDEVKRNEALKQSSEASLAIVKSYVQSNEQLDKMKSAYDKIAQAASEMKGSVSSNSFFMGENVRFTNLELEASKKSLEVLMKKKEELNKFQAVEFAEQSKIEIGKLNIDPAQKEELQKMLNDIQIKSGDSLKQDKNSGEREKSAKEANDLMQKYKDKVKGVKDLTEQQTSNLLDNLGLMLEANKAEREASIDAKVYTEQQKINTKEVENKISKQVAEENLLSKLQEREQKRADLVGKTAVGYAAHFQSEKKVYDLLLKRIDNAEKEGNIIRQNISEAAKIASVGTGLDEGIFARAMEGDQEAIEKINQAQQDYIEKLKEKGADPAQDKVNAALKMGITLLDKQLENSNKLLDLDQQRIDKAMVLKEGYLDVIQEMSTSSNLVSGVLADSSRGLVSLHQMQMMSTGKATGGAYSRGFASINAFAGSMDIGGAAGFSQEGFKGPSSNQNTVTSAYYQENLANKKDMMHSRANIDRGARPGIVSGFASGGVIEGSPSDKDNRVGIVDGKTPIGLASGEFVINAKSTKNNLSLLQAINDGRIGGYVGGGQISNGYTQFQKRKSAETAQSSAPAASNEQASDVTVNPDRIKKLKESIMHVSENLSPSQIEKYLSKLSNSLSDEELQIIYTREFIEGLTKRASRITETEQNQTDTSDSRGINFNNVVISDRGRKAESKKDMTHEEAFRSNYEEKIRKEAATVAKSKLDKEKISKTEYKNSGSVSNNSSGGINSPKAGPTLPDVPSAGQTKQSKEFGAAAKVAAQVAMSGNPMVAAQLAYENRDAISATITAGADALVGGNTHGQGGSRGGSSGGRGRSINIGQLYLNGKLIGKDLSGSEESIKTAAQNASS